MQQSAIAVLGSGVTGLSIARNLRAQNIVFDIFDSRAVPPNDTIFVTQFGLQIIRGAFDYATLKQYQQIIVSPGIKDPYLLLNFKDKIIGDIELFAQQCHKPIVAITGSNGKSTVTSLVAAILEDCAIKVAVGGNLDLGYRSHWGKPALDLLEQEAEVYILELSSFQLQHTRSLKPAVATILNVAPDHLDYHSNFDNYLRAKQHIYSGSAKAIYYLCDSNTIPSADYLGERICFGDAKNRQKQWGVLECDGDQFIARKFQTLIAITELPVCLQAHAINVCAALTIVEQFGVSAEQALPSVLSFSGLAHRAENVGTTQNGVVCINDSKATNVAATVAILRSLKRNVILLLGGQTKGESFLGLAKECAKVCKHIIIFGIDSAVIAGQLQTKVATKIVDSLQQAVSCAMTLAREGDCVLLSPACASFDQFESYRHRGVVFKQLVQTYG